MDYVQGFVYVFVMFCERRPLFVPAEDRVRDLPNMHVCVDLFDRFAAHSRA